jgi:hypothetical protein
MTGSDFHVVQSTPAMADALAAIQQACFPTLSAAELLTADQYRRHTEIFPEGQLAVIGPGGQPVASSTDLIRHVDFDHIQHRFMEATGDNWLTTHEPDGDWLYGADIGIHPDYQGRGLSRLLYDARQDLIRRLNLKGHVAGGMLKGYGAYRAAMSAQTYIDKVVAGEIFDPTLSVQLRRGFVVAGVIDHYLDDPTCDNKAALIVWRNADYRPD